MLIGASTQIESLLPKLSPVSPDATSTPLEALKIVERVKGIDPSSSAWEVDNEGGSNNLAYFSATSTQPISLLISGPGLTATCSMKALSV